MAVLYPSYKKLIVLLQNEGVGADNSGVDTGPLGLPITYVGTVSQASWIKKFGNYSSYTPGSSNYALLPASIPQLAFGNGVWRIGFWINLPYVSNYGTSGVFSLPMTTGVLKVSISTSGQVVLNSGLTSPTSSVSGVIISNTWNYIELGRVSNGYVYCYINGGNAFVSYVGQSPLYGSVNASPRVGHDGTNGMVGYLDDFFIELDTQISNRVPTDTWMGRGPRISGTVKDSAGLFASRKVRAYDVGLGRFQGETTSDATTGGYTLELGTLNACNVVVAPAEGELLNALVLANINPL